MEQKEKFEKLKAWLDENGVKYFEHSENTPGENHWTLYIKKYRIPVYDDAIVDNYEAYQSECKKKRRPLFVRPSESMEFILEKAANMVAQGKKGLQRLKHRPYNKALYEFVAKGVWQKIDHRYRKGRYHSNPAEFFDKFIDRQANQFEGDFEKTAASFVDEFAPEFKPKPKRKRMHFVPVRSVKPIKH